MFDSPAHHRGTQEKKPGKPAIDINGKKRYTIRASLVGARVRGGITMSTIRVGEGESLESALKRFKRKSSPVVAEVRKRKHYEKPSVKRKKKAEAARKRKY